MKKIISLGLAVSLLLALSACGGSAAPDAPATGAAPVTSASPETTASPETSAASVTTAAPETTAAPVRETTVSGTLAFDRNTPSVDARADKGYAWDRGTLTLTLCGMVLESENGVGVRLDCDATVELADGTESAITVEGNDADLGCTAILCTGNLSLNGKGTLKILSGYYESFAVDTGVTAYGIAAKEKTLTVEDGVLEIQCGNPGGGNDAYLRNIQGLRAGTVEIAGGTVTIDTGDVYTTAKGAFLDGIYATDEFRQTGGALRVTIGNSEELGVSVFLENLAICSDGGFTMIGGSLEARCGAETANGKAIGAKTIAFGAAKIAAGADENGRDASYTDQKYVKATY